MNSVATLLLLTLAPLAAHASDGRQAPTAWHVAALPSATEVVIQRGAERHLLRLAGVRAPSLSNEAERQWARFLLERSARPWLGLEIVQAQRGRGGWILELEGEKDLAVEIVAAGLGWAATAEPKLRQAERRARTSQSGIWSASTWSERRALAAAPVLIPPPKPVRRKTVAERLPATAQPWAERFEAFERSVAELKSAADEGAEPEL